MEGYRQDWELSFEKDTRTRGGWYVYFYEHNWNIIDLCGNEMKQLGKFKDFQWHLALFSNKQISLSETLFFYFTTMSNFEQKLKENVAIDVKLVIMSGNKVESLSQVQG